MLVVVGTSEKSCSFLMYPNVNMSCLIFFNKKKKKRKNVPFSPAGNRTPVSRVTGGDTHHYTTEDPTSVV